MAPLELALVLASALLHAWWNVSIKGSGDPLCFNLSQAPLSALVLIAVLPFVDLREVPADVWRLLGATAFAHALYFYWMSRAYEYGDLGLVYPIARSTPAFLPIVAIPLLGETISPGGGLGIAIVVAGIWAVHGRGWRLSRLAEPAAIFAYLTLAGTIAYSLIDKAAMATLAEASWSSPLPRAVVYSLLLNVVCTLVFGPMVLAARGAAAVADTFRRQYRTATAAAAVSLVGYTLILRALETAPVSYVVAVRQTSVIFALGLGALVLGERPDRLRIVGAVLTVAGVALIALSS